MQGIVVFYEFEGRRLSRTLRLPEGVGYLEIAETVDLEGHDPYSIVVVCNTTCLRLERGKFFCQMREVFLDGVSLTYFKPGSVVDDCLQAAGWKWGP